MGPRRPLAGLADNFHGNYKVICQLHRNHDISTRCHLLSLYTCGEASNYNLQAPADVHRMDYNKPNAALFSPFFCSGNPLFYIHAYISAEFFPYIKTTGSDLLTSLELRIPSQSGIVSRCHIFFFRPLLRRPCRVLKGPLLIFEFFGAYELLRHY